MGPMVLSLLGAVGSVFSGWFTGKAVQKIGDAQAVGQSAGQVIGEIARADATASIAHTIPIVAETFSGNWLASSWRPITMLIFLAMIVSRWFGYIPPNMSPAEIDHVWALLTGGLYGLGGLRSVEKVLDKVNVGKVISHYVGEDVTNKKRSDDDDEGD